VGADAAILVRSPLGPVAHRHPTPGRDATCPGRAPSGLVGARLATADDSLKDHVFPFRFALALPGPAGAPSPRPARSTTMARGSSRGHRHRARTGTAHP